jgi:hypothetical protein
MDTRRWALELDNLKGKTLCFLNHLEKLGIRQVLFGGCLSFSYAFRIYGYKF